MSLPRPFWKLTASIFAIVVGTWVVLFILGQYEYRLGLTQPIMEAVQVGVVIGVGLVVFYFFRNFAKSLGEGVSPHLRAIINFLILIVIALFVLFAVLGTLQIPASTLLIGGGILSIVVGLAVSTVFGNIITGALMLTTFPFRVGDNVLVGNVPGKILEITTFYTKVLNSSGSETIIPNTAMIQGSIAVTRVSTDGSAVVSRLHYSVGDRIYTNYIGGEGTVTDITPFNTKVHLDSGRDALIPNNSIFSGNIQIAKVGGYVGALTLALKLEGNAENAIEAMKEVAKSNPGLYKSPPVVLYSSLEGPVVELKVSCEVEPAKSEEARSSLLRAAYLESRRTRSSFAEKQ